MKRTPPMKNHPLKFDYVLSHAAPGFVLIRLKPGMLQRLAWRILLTLAENAGRVVTRQQIYDALWHEHIVNENQIDVQISNLRRALKQTCPGSELDIVTMTGVGYILDLDPSKVHVIIPPKSEPGSQN